MCILLCPHVCVPSCVHMCLCLSMQASVYVSSSDTLCFHLRLPLGTGRWCQPQCLKNCPLGACDSLRVCHDGRAGRLVCVFMATGVLCASKRAGSRAGCVCGGGTWVPVCLCVCVSIPAHFSVPVAGMCRGLGAPHVAGCLLSASARGTACLHVPPP